MEDFFYNWDMRKKLVTKYFTKDDTLDDLIDSIIDVTDKEMVQANPELIYDIVLALTEGDANAAEKFSSSDKFEDKKSSAAFIKTCVRFFKACVNSEINPFIHPKSLDEFIVN